MCRQHLKVALLATVVLAVGLLTPSAVLAQGGHGVTIQKTCDVSPRTCDTDAECSDNNACNGLETCDQSIPDTISCRITVTNADSFGDTLTIKNAFDVIKPFAVDQVIIPDLPISAVSGTTTCQVGGIPLVGDATTWCTLAPGASVTFLSNTYEPTPTDPSPLPDQGNVVVADVCDSPTTENCNTGNNTASFSAQTVLQSGCVPGTPPNCDDSNACTNDSCDPATGCVNTPISCEDNNACTADSCDPVIGCVNAPISCDDGNACTLDACDPVTGCTHSEISCDDTNACTNDSCDPATGCVNTPISCDDGNACTTDACDPATGCTHSAISCDDGNACTTDACDPATGCTHSAISCDDANACTNDACDPATGCTHDAINCDDNNVCTNDSCDPVAGCQHEDNGTCAAPTGCRITAGGITPNGNVDATKFADVVDGTFGGQVGAPCGCIGPGGFEGFENIQGNWTFMRKGPGVGSFHATGFNSLVCGCDPNPGGSDGVLGSLQGKLTGSLCNPGNRNTGPFPPNAPANLACFSGIGGFNETSGQRDITVAFRVEVEDRSQPGGGKNSDPSPSVMRIRIWIPTGDETAESLAQQIACNGPLGTDFCPDVEIRDPDIDDGTGGLLHGAIQIHKQIAAHEGTCPVPGESCPVAACPGD